MKFRRNLARLNSYSRVLTKELCVQLNVQSHHSISVFIPIFLFSGFLGWQQQAPIRGWWAFEREEIAWPPVRPDRERGRQKDRQNEVGFGAQGGNHRWAKVCDQIFANGFLGNFANTFGTKKSLTKNMEAFQDICESETKDSPVVKQRNTQVLI